MSEAARTFAELTAQSVGPKYVDWLRELEDRFGDDRVVAALLAESSRGVKTPALMYRVRDRLAEEDARSRQRAAPLVHLEGAALMAVVRGKAKQPIPYTYDSRGLTRAEYDEVLKWADARRTA